jgi:hypothetical protein
MCNGWKHEPGCACGFGGDTGTACGLNGLTPLRSYESYVNRNARCPECSSPVFYFRAENGGRVFFDDLGPPWPKHPCTDRSPRTSVKIERETVASAPRWERDAWKPFFNMPTHAPNDEQVFDGAIGDGRTLTLWCSRRHTKLGWLQNWNHSFPVFLKPVGGDEYEMATRSFTPRGECKEVVIRVRSILGL